MTGRTLSHYQILEPLGSGGMGEVFKARDTRLNRLVAIKVLRPEHVSQDVRKQRFIQEAQAASALNHPNIVTIYDIDQQDGADFLVMEYIAGRTLDARIPRQGMRLNEALRVAVQIAEGLRRAHAAGIVHRDLKPSNIMVADGGLVKILDFGLAKLVETGEVSEDEEDATRTARLETEEGTVMGTTAYMSPEQAEGRKLDARTDIFSFGVVLYEMLTGRKAFDGDTRVSTMSAILKEEPKPIENIPADLEKILRRCLRKDREKRVQHMDDLRLALEEIREESESGHFSPQPREMKNRQRARWPWLLAAVGLLGVISAAMIWNGRAKAPVAYRLRQITADIGITSAPAISPDGRLIAYASDRASGSTLDIWVHPLAQNAQPIRVTTHEADDVDPTFSADGGQIAFYSRRDGGGIYVVSALGGQERLLIRRAGRPRYSPDGQWLAYSTNPGRNPTKDSAVWVMPAAGGSARRVAPEIGWANDPFWAPDSKSIVVIGMKATAAHESLSAWRAPVDGAPATRLYGRSADRTFIFPADWQGESILGTAGSEIRRLDAAHPDQSVLLFPTTGTAFGARTAAGQIVFESSISTYQRRLWSVPLNPNAGQVQGPNSPVPNPGGSQRWPSISDDGSKLLFTHYEPTRYELRLRDLPSGKETVVHSSSQPGSGAFRGAISPDGSRVAFSDGEGIALVEASGGQPVRLAEAPYATLFAWAPDGGSLFYYRSNPIRWFVLDPASRESREAWSNPKRIVHGLRASPDGRWVTFHVPDDPQHPVFVAPFRDGKVANENEWIRVKDGNDESNVPWWSPDGNLLYWMMDRDGFMCVWARRLDSSTKAPKGDPFAVLHVHEARRSLAGTGLGGFGPAISRDRMIFALPEYSSNIWLAEPELKK